MPVIAQTPRLLLRTWEHGDQKKLDRHCNTVRVMEHLGGPQPKRLLRDDVRWFRQSWTEQGLTYWVVEREEDGEFLGFCGLELLTRDAAPSLAGEVEVGWRLREDAWAGVMRPRRHRWFSTSPFVFAASSAWFRGRTLRMKPASK